MKKIIIIVILFASCNKPDGPEPLTNTIPLTVLEPVSDLPVKDAQVIFFECTIGCIGSNTRFTGLTDENGVCNVPSESFNNSSVEMNIYKEGYWPFFIPAQRSRKATLSPEGWLRLYVPAYTGSYLNITIGPKRLPYGWGESTTYHDVQDTVLLIKAFGGEQNRINWQLISDSSYLISYDSLDVEIPRFDTTANVTLNL